MGQSAAIVTNTGEIRLIDYGKGLANSLFNLDFYCHLVADGKDIDPVAEYALLEIPGEPPLCAIVSSLVRALWHSEMDYEEDDFDTFVEIWSQIPQFSPEDYTREAFDKLIADGKAAYIPLDELLDNTLLMIERLKKVNIAQPAANGHTLPEYLPETMEQLRDALLDLKKTDSKTARFSVG